MLVFITHSLIYLIVFDLITVHAPVRTHKQFMDCLHNRDNDNDNTLTSDGSQSRGAIHYCSMVPLLPSGAASILSSGAFHD